MADRRPTYDDVAPIRDLVSNQDAWEAQHYLDTVPHDYAVAEANAEYLQDLKLVTEAVGALFSDERAVDKRKWEARASAAYLERLTALRDARVVFLEMKARRDAARTKIEIWRTERADKRERGVGGPMR